MKLNPLSISGSLAAKQLKIFMIVGYACGIVGLFAFGFLGIVATAFGARCVMLTFNKSLRTKDKLILFRAASAILVILGLVDLAGAYA